LDDYSVIVSYVKQRVKSGPAPAGRGAAAPHSLDVFFVLILTDWAVPHFYSIENAHGNLARKITEFSVNTALSATLHILNKLLSRRWLHIFPSGLSTIKSGAVHSVS
jgi:hypothetical protein